MSLQTECNSGSLSVGYVGLGSQEEAARDLGFVPPILAVGGCCCLALVWRHRPLVGLALPAHAVAVGCSPSLAHSVPYVGQPNPCTLGLVQLWVDELEAQQD